MLSYCNVCKKFGRCRTATIFVLSTTARTAHAVKISSGCTDRTTVSSVTSGIGGKENVLQRKTGRQVDFCSKKFHSPEKAIRNGRNSSSSEINKASQTSLHGKSSRENTKVFSTQANEQEAPPPSQEPQEPQDSAPLDLYTFLKISPESSEDEIKRTVRVRRVETYPDKRKGQGYLQQKRIRLVSKKIW